MQKNRPPNPLTTEQPSLVMKHPFSLRVTALLLRPNSNPHIYAKRRIKAQIKKLRDFLKVKKAWNPFIVSNLPF